MVCAEPGFGVFILLYSMLWWKEARLRAPIFNTFLF